MPRPIIFRIGRLSGLKSRPALIEGPLPQAPLVQPSTRRLNNGPAEYDLLMMAGISVLLSTTPAPDPQWQSNQPELQGRTHELALLQSQQFSGLLRAQTPAVAAAANQGRRLTVDPAVFEASQSRLLQAMAPLAVAVGQGRVLVIDPGAVDIPQSRLLEAQVPLTAVAATFNPRPLVSNTPWVEVQESFTWSQYLIEFDAPLLRPLVVDPERPQEFQSKLLRAYDVSVALSFQANAPEQYALTHELVLIQSQQFSNLLRAFDTTPAVTSGINPRVINASAADVQAYPSFRIQAQTPLAATPDFRPRILVNALDSPQDVPSKSFAPRFEPALVNTRVLVVGPGQPQEFPSKLSAPRFEASAALVGIQPHVLVVQAQDNIDGLFTSVSRLVVPNHVEPFVPPPPPPPEPTGGATIGDPYARAIIEQQIRELNEREQHEADRRQREKIARGETSADSQSLIAIPASIPSPTQRLSRDSAAVPGVIPQVDIGSRVQAVERAASHFAAALQQQEAQQAARQAQLDAIAHHALIIGIQIDLAALQDEDDLDAILALLLLL